MATKPKKDVKAPAGKGSTPSSKITLKKGSKSTSWPS